MNDRAPDRRGAPLRNRLVEDEAGITMVLVIGMAVVLMLTAAIGLSITNSSLDRSVRHARFEGTEPLAEHGIDLALARLQQDGAWVTTTSTPFPSNPTAAEEETWALAELAAAPVIPTANGDYAVVKPPGRQTIYAAGWIPDRASAVRPRMVKAEYLFSSYRPPGAILTGGDLELGGNATVTGSLGDVHSNGDIVVVGTSVTVAGEVSAVGTISGGSALDREPGASAIQVPAVDPAEIYDLNQARYSRTEPDGSYGGDWYDLCPDGSVKSPASGGPCTGTVVGDGNTNTGFRGWKFNTNGGGRTWVYADTEAYDGVYYAYQSSIDVASRPGRDGESWRATLLAEGQTTTAPSQSFGDIRISGRPYVIGFIDGLSVVAGRDLEILGTGSTEGDGSYQGLLAAHEQVKITGNPLLTGSVVAEDATDTAGSPVTQNFVSGSMTIRYEDPLDTNLVSLIRTTLWLEL